MADPARHRRRLNAGEHNGVEAGRQQHDVLLSLHTAEAIGEVGQVHDLVIDQRSALSDRVDRDVVESRIAYAIGCRLPLMNSSKFSRVSAVTGAPCALT